MSATTDDEKNAADAKIIDINEEIADLELVATAATTQAARLLEATRNSQALAALATEISTAKNASDEVIEGLVESQERYAKAI